MLFHGIRGNKVHPAGILPTNTSKKIFPESVNTYYNKEEIPEFFLSKLQNSCGINLKNDCWKLIYFTVEIHSAYKKFYWSLKSDRFPTNVGSYTFNDQQLPFNVTKKMAFDACNHIPAATVSNTMPQVCSSPPSPPSPSFPTSPPFPSSNSDIPISTRSIFARVSRI